MLVLLTLACLQGCERMPETYAPPVQRQPFENFRPYRITRVVDMSDGDADAHIVRDVLPGSGSWRWAGQHPVIRVALPKAENLIYTIDFSLADATFKSTGPVSMTFFVNDHELGSDRYTAPGSYHFEKSVPADWLEGSKDATVGAEVDKVWVSPEDGVKLGFILTRIGLRQDASKK